MMKQKLILAGVLIGLPALVMAFWKGWCNRA